MKFSINKDFLATVYAEDTKDTKGTEVPEVPEVPKRATKVAKAGKATKVKKVAEDVKVEEDTKVAEAKRTRVSRNATDYEPEVVREMLVKDNGRGYREYLELSVKRFGEEGIPYVHFSARQESEMYCGYKKGKHISFPLELLYEFKDLLNELDRECDEKNIE